jgi:hypothetical protein
MRRGILGRILRHRVALTRRGGMNKVKPFQRKFQRVGLVELVATIPRLRIDIDAHNVKPGALISLRGTTSAAEQIEQSRLHRHATRTESEPNGDLRAEQCVFTASSVAQRKVCKTFAKQAQLLANDK